MQFGVGEGVVTFYTVYYHF